MAGTAMRPGAAAAPRRRGSRGHFASTFKAERGELLFYLAAFTVGAFDFALGVKDNLFEIFFTALASVFKNRHSLLPSLEL